jgi:hypothetical protein
VFQWPRLVLAHQGNGLVLPCRLVVEGKICHIKQIGFSPTMCPWTHNNSLAHCHHINSPNGRAFYPCNIKWHWCKTCIPPYLACPLASNTMDSTRSTFFP